MVDLRQQRLFGMDEEMIKEMADDAMKRVTEFINRSAGQHIRAMREQAQKKNEKFPEAIH